MKNLNTFLEEKKIKFSSEKQALRWVRKLKAKSLVKVGLSYFIDEKELSKLLEDDLNNKKQLRSKRIESGKKRAERNFISKKSVLKKVMHDKLITDKDKF